VTEIGIIGGTGVYNPDILTDIREEVIENMYGKAKVVFGKYQGRDVVFLARHGLTHSVPPHLVNYRANIWALKEIGVKSIFATAAVGSLNEKMMPGDFVIVDQFLDFTKNRINTFFEGGNNGVVHTDMTYPYCPHLREQINKTAELLEIKAHDKGTYVCTEGPRFETPAEIHMFHMLGGDLVGMTSVPEVVLAREAGICYSTIAMVTNYAAGISPQELTHQEVVETMTNNGKNLGVLLMKTVENLPETRDCKCSQSQESV
jgi:5'-methylthioadenosine phosphorylase